MISTVDPDSRHIHKSRQSYRNGYKAHVVVEPTTGLICGQQLTAGNAPDGPTGVELMEHEPKRRQVLADSAYGAGPDSCGTRQASASSGDQALADHRHRPVRSR